MGFFEKSTDERQADRFSTGVVGLTEDSAALLALMGIKRGVKGAVRGGKTPMMQTEVGKTTSTHPKGKALRADAIPQGSKLEYLGPGKIKFDGVEFRAVRDLGHLSEAELKGMLKGRNPVDTSGVSLDGHHFQQQYHREPGAFMVEIPDPNHCIYNPIQHPLGRSGGLTAEQRADWNSLRAAFNKERAKTELLRRTSNE